MHRERSKDIYVSGYKARKAGNISKIIDIMQRLPDWKIQMENGTILI
jgi:hypothetical protein